MPVLLGCNNIKRTQKSHAFIDAMAPALYFGILLTARGFTTVLGVLSWRPLCAVCSSTDMKSGDPPLCVRVQCMLTVWVGGQGRGS
jgi:hypothetical protein